MKCPSCHRPVDHEADSCYSCGYSAEEAMKQFGFNQVKMKRIHDAADCLRVRESHDISDYFDSLESRFPQLLFAVYIGELKDISISELGFWLLNHASVDDVGFARTNDCAILLIIDIDRKQAGFSLGFFAERLLDEEVCLRILMASRSDFLNGEWGDGILGCFRRVEKHLVKQAKKMRKLNREERTSYLEGLDAEPALEVETYGWCRMPEEAPTDSTALQPR